MFSEELQKLIEASLVDGVITDLERAVIRKRALLEGVDPDEVDLILDSEIQKIRKSTQPSKQGVVKKCPNCGAAYEAGSVRCPQCGYVFVGVEANSSAKQLFSMLEKIDLDYRDRKDSGILTSALGRKTTIQKIDDEKANTIKGFPVPTSKDDLLEFIPSMETKWHHTSFGQTMGNEKMAYRSKYNECIQKAHVLFGNDPDFSEYFKKYEKNKYSVDNLGLWQRLWGILIILLMLMIIGGVLGSQCSGNKADEQKLLLDKQYTEMVTMIDNLETPTSENYIDCKRKILSVVWKEHDTSRYDVQEYQEKLKAQFEEKKKGYILILNTIYKKNNKEDDPDLNNYVNDVLAEETIE